MVYCVRTKFGGIHFLTHESREHKKEVYEKSKKQVELDEDNEADRANKAAAAVKRLLELGLIGLVLGVFTTSV